MKFSCIALALACAFSLAACSNTQPPSPTASASPTPTVTQQVVGGAAAATPGVLTAINAVDPVAIAKINSACQPVLNGLTAIKSCLSGGAASSTGAVAQLQTLAASGCGSAAQLAANDAQPVTATNSGDSVAWLNSLLAEAETYAPLACAAAKAL